MLWKILLPTWIDGGQHRTVASWIGLLLMDIHDTACCYGIILF